MTDSPEMTPREIALREDLNREYYALVGAVTDADGRQLTVKGWSVTLSLAGLALGFQQQHYALFGLAAATAAAFWFLDGLKKGHQARYYSRMRDIELAAYRLNSVALEGLDKVSAPRIDMSWSFQGTGEDWRTQEPRRRSPEEVRRLLRLRFLLPNVMLPHVLAVVLGVVLFVAAANDAWGLQDLVP